eukprot:TRINITY_DN66677_c1_g2_i1.p1 TRINITY_DN66677_c1_g2~~TRINITY_DN66677_c1_g2_i1.p1  ORF type:complete len:574 (-),score=75.35 TRINITY_DN66677_c1_g2_i1:1456-3177(-)
MTGSTCRELLDLKAEAAALRTQLSVWKATWRCEREGWEEERQTYKTTLSILNKEHETFRADLEAKTSLVEQLQSEIAHEREALQTELDAATTRSEQLEHTLKSTEEELEHMKKTTAEAKSTSTEAEALQAKLQVRVDENQRLQQAIEEARMRAAEWSQLRETDKAEYHADLNEKNAQLETITEQLATAHQTIEATTAALTHVQKQVVSQTMELDAARSKLTSHIKIVHTLLATLGTLEEKRMEEEDNRVSLCEHLDQLVLTFEKQRAMDAMAFEADLEKQQEECTDLQQQLQRKEVEHNSQMDKLQSELSMVSNLYKEMKSDYGMLESEMITSTTNWNQERNAMLKHHREKELKWDVQESALIEERELLQEQVDSLRKRVQNEEADWNEERALLSERLDTAEKRAAKEHAEVTMLTEGMQRMSAQLLSTQGTTFAEDNDEMCTIPSLKAESAALIERVAELQEEIWTKDKRIQDLTREKKAYIAELEKKNCLVDSLLGEVEKEDGKGWSMSPFKSKRDDGEAHPHRSKLQKIIAETTTRNLELQRSLEQAQEELSTLKISRSPTPSPKKTGNP